MKSISLNSKVKIILNEESISALTHYQFLQYKKSRSVESALFNAAMFSGTLHVGQVYEIRLSELVEVLGNSPDSINSGSEPFKNCCMYLDDKDTKDVDDTVEYLLNNN